MMTTSSGGDDDCNLSFFKDLVEHIRSSDEEERKLTIMRIPELILQSLEHKNDVLNQLLLVIYNLTTDSDIYENLTIGNRTNIIRHLLRLYTDNIKDHQTEQIDALVKLINHANSSQLLIELANVLYNCGNHESKEVNDKVEEAFNDMRNRAAANLYPDALLMLHSMRG
jgi:hypothetical protein